MALRRVKAFSDIAEYAASDWGNFAEIRDEDYRRILRLLLEEHNAYCERSDRSYAETVQYYTVWAHQIKTPIASMRLRLQNEDSALSRALTVELNRIERYVEMATTFLRLNSASTDYVFREYDLDTLVRAAVKRFSSEFIARRIRLDYAPLNTTVVTDEKWLVFVIEQILSNALKYTPSGGVVAVTLESPKTLRIRDTGIGIAPEDLPRIFENGYTGYNGRADRKASGIGLYLCRRICENLGHTVSISSELDVGTTAEIDLSQRALAIE